MVCSFLAGVPPVVIGLLCNLTLPVRHSCFKSLCKRAKLKGASADGTSALDAQSEDPGFESMVTHRSITGVLIPIGVTKLGYSIV